MQATLQATDTPILEQVNSLFTDVIAWIETDLLEPERLTELAVLATAIILGRFIALWCLQTAINMAPTPRLGELLQARRLRPITMGLFMLLLAWTGYFVLNPLLAHLYLIPIATSLLAAWVIIHLATAIIPNRAAARALAIVAWSLAALNIIGLLSPVLEVLDGAALPVGDSKISVLDIINALLMLSLLVWSALSLSGFLESRLKALDGLPPSAAVLIGKATRIILLIIAFLLSLDAAGIDLTALAVFGGALGVGIGFGLQKVVSNFISGLILLMDQSIKPGDVVEINDTYGEINKLAARYTSVITRDGTEFLIPNENMITQPVINWSHSNRLVRRKIPVQISYDSDVNTAMALMNEAAAEEQRVLKNPAPRTLLKGFGESGLDLELRMWIHDPQHGVSNIASDVMLRIWEKFKAGGIDFPYPHRVVELLDKRAGDTPEPI